MPLMDVENRAHLVSLAQQWTRDAELGFQNLHASRVAFAAHHVRHDLRSGGRGGHALNWRGRTPEGDGAH